MAKKETTKVELTSSAFSIVRKSPGKCALVRIRFNLDASELAAPEIVADDIGMDEARERFKILVANEIFA